MPAGPIRVPVAFQEQAGEGVSLLVLEAPAVAASAAPGQFLHVRVGASHDPLLRRPFSVHDTDGEQGTVSLLYQIRGRGTAWLAARRVGEVLDVLGPLGHGFPPPLREGVCFLVGGGLGLAPLFFLAKRLREQGRRIVFIVGAANAATLCRLDALRALDLTLAVTTEDGSLGRQGLVTELLPDLMRWETPATLYACGPWGMLREVATISKKAGVPTFVSLEEVMACGTGLCRGCAVPVNGAGEMSYVRACTEGPVLPAERVAWPDA